MRRPLLNILALAATAALPALAAAQLSVVYEQTPASPLLSGQFANLNSAYATQRVADHFTLAANTTITELTWWGFMYSPLQDKQVGISNLSGFQVQIFLDDGASGTPGTVVHAETIPMDGTVGNDVSETAFGQGAFNGPTFEFHAGLGSPVALTAGQTYWLAINAVLFTGTSTSDVFTWMDQGAAGGGTLSDGMFVVDGLFDPVDGVWVRLNGGNGGGKGFRVFGLAVVDSDNDGLSDADEAVHGTDPANPDTDADGLLDGTEVDLAGSGSCLDPLTADSDGDMLLDGEEVTLGYDPCNVDTDGDGLDDWLDPDPLVSLDSFDDIALAVRDVSDFVGGIDLSLFVGPNENAAAARRNSMAVRLQLAANLLERNRPVAARILIISVREQVDGDTRPRDWLNDSPEQDLLLQYLESLNAVINGM